MRFFNTDLAGLSFGERVDQKAGPSSSKAPESG
jgi:hypothetical protein